MALRFRAHRASAIIVLVLAGLWVATGHFASVGSEEASASTHDASGAAEPTAAAPVSSLRTVSATTPVFTDHARTIRISGLTQPDKRATLAARSNGIIASLDIAQGEAVEAGAVVLRLEGPDLTASVADADATLAQRVQELDAAEKLYARGSLPELQLTASRAAKAAAESQLSQARAAVDRLSLSAPFAGVVDTVDAELGEWVQAGTPIATVLSLDPIVVSVAVGELDIGHVSTDDRAEVRLVDGTTLDGTVRFVAREGTDQTRTFPVEIALPNPDHKIPSGMTAEVLLYTDPVRAVSIPRSVITLSTEGELGLRVIGADNVARFQQVELIDDTPEGLIVAGVPEDVRIIVAGQDLVRDGDKVMVAEDIAKVTPAPAAEPAEGGATE